MARGPRNPSPKDVHADPETLTHGQRIARALGERKPLAAAAVDALKPFIS